jgi:hypothetical protein
MNISYAPCEIACRNLTRKMIQKYQSKMDQFFSLKAVL